MTAGFRADGKVWTILGIHAEDRYRRTLVFALATIVSPFDGMRYMRRRET